MREAWASRAKRSGTPSARRSSITSGAHSSSTTFPVANSSCKIRSSTRTNYSAFGTNWKRLSLICDLVPQRARRDRARSTSSRSSTGRQAPRRGGLVDEPYAAGVDVGLIFESAANESPETRALLRSKLAGRNQVMDSIIASLESGASHSGRRELSTAHWQRLMSTRSWSTSPAGLRKVRDLRRRLPRATAALTLASPSPGHPGRPLAVLRSGRSQPDPMDLQNGMAQQPACRPRAREVGQAEAVAVAASCP